jgi:hypothetical protein
VPSVGGIQRKILGLGLVGIGAAILIGRPGPWGVFLGASVVVASLWIYALLFDAVFRTGRRRLALGLTFVKLAAFLALGWWAMSRGVGTFDPLGFAVGVTCLPLAALWEAMQAKGR